MRLACNLVILLSTGSLEHFILGVLVGLKYEAASGCYLMSCPFALGRLSKLNWFHEFGIVWNIDVQTAFHSVDYTSMKLYLTRCRNEVHHFLSSKQG